MCTFDTEVEHSSVFPGGDVPLSPQNILLFSESTTYEPSFLHFLHF